MRQSVVPLYPLFVQFLNFPIWLWSKTREEWMAHGPILVQNDQAFDRVSLEISVSTCIKSSLHQVWDQSTFLRSSIGWWLRVFEMPRCSSKEPGLIWQDLGAWFTNVHFNMQHDMNILQLKSNWWLQVAYRTYIQHNRGCHLRLISACSKNVANVIQSRRRAMR